MTGGLVGTGLGMRVRRLPRGGRAKPAIAIPHHALLFVNADIGLAAKLGCGVHLTRQLAQAMKLRGVSKKAMAERIHTSRSHSDRILDERDTGLTLATLTRAAQLLGCRLKIKLAAESAQAAYPPGTSLVSSALSP